MKTYTETSILSYRLVNLEALSQPETNPVDMKLLSQSAQAENKMIPCP